MFYILHICRTALRHKSMMAIARTKLVLVRTSTMIQTLSPQTVDAGGNGGLHNRMRRGRFSVAQMQLTLAFEDFDAYNRWTDRQDIAECTGSCHLVCVLIFMGQAEAAGPPNSSSLE